MGSELWPAPDNGPRDPLDPTILAPTGCFESIEELEDGEVGKFHPTASENRSVLAQRRGIWQTIPSGCTKEKHIRVAHRRSFPLEEVAFLPQGLGRALRHAAHGQKEVLEGALLRAGALGMACEELRV